MDNIAIPYEVLSPWAEADPIPLHRLAPRLGMLEGKTIGLLSNNKRAAITILDATEKRLKARFPSVKTSRFIGRSFSVSALEKNREGEFNDWIERMDAVIAAVGD